GRGGAGGGGRAGGRAGAPPLRRPGRMAGPARIAARGRRAVRLGPRHVQGRLGAVGPDPLGVAGGGPRRNRPPVLRTGRDERLWGAARLGTRPVRASRAPRPDDPRAPVPLPRRYRLTP